MKTYGGSGGIAPRILDLGTRRRWVVSFTPRPFYSQGKNPWYPLDRRLGAPSAVLDAVVKREIPSPRRESNPRTPIVQLVAQRCTDWAITALDLLYMYIKQDKNSVIVRTNRMWKMYKLWRTYFENSLKRQTSDLLMLRQCLFHIGMIYSSNPRLGKENFCFQISGHNFFRNMKVTRSDWI
jgi:hypothetical protein